jgi:hypothetical protein
MVDESFPFLFFGGCRGLRRRLLLVRTAANAWSLVLSGSSVEKSVFQEWKRGRKGYLINDGLFFPLVKR